jgi:hypothetical protein
MPMALGRVQRQIVHMHLLAKGTILKGLVTISAIFRDSLSLTFLANGDDEVIPLDRLVSDE